MIILLLIVLGLSLGSFVNALVWRIHEQSKISSKKKKPVTPGDLSILKGRSMCPHCRHDLAVWDLVPLLSWVSLNGKCRYCHKPIGTQYPAVEAATAVLFVASYLWWPMDFNAMGIFNFAAWLIILTGFMALLVYDFRWLILPNRIVYPLTIVAGLTALMNITIYHGGMGLLTDTIISVAVAGGLFYGLFMVSDGKWIGGGDVKLGFLIGLLIASPLQSFLVLFTASCLGTLVILPGLATKRLNTRSKIPFGPFLIVAAILVKLFGASVVAWYRRKFLFY